MAVTIDGVVVKAVQRALIVTGGLAMAYAVFLAFRSPDFRPIGQIPFMILVLVVHDVLLLPAAIVVGFLAGRLVPRHHRDIVHLALFATLVVSLFATPLALGLGRRADVPSALPLDYTRGLLICLGVIWTTSALALTFKTYRVRRCSKIARRANSASAVGYPAKPAKSTPPDRSGR